MARGGPGSMPDPPRAVVPHRTGPYGYAPQPAWLPPTRSATIRSA